ncbi:hypothetical protein F8O06_02705 [Pseudoclavibacter sp. CFCC 14310]|uniref:hypothetical protein n=1 Tax=Pseudoclavibacter sp. CFCC 14310 TaxID=2615180 RepID=UPI001300F26E|nr:hypothetical protein [Pseudoclavibacter sp. CFCC 14310]KAB1647467.1 hypothetical protein F8O06_02705 [Pseudoclavibacter sp. CFCC 14310]
MHVRIGDLRSGRRILDLPFMTASWTDVLNDAEDIRAKVTLNDRQIRQLDLYNASLPGKTFIVVEDEQLTVGGPIWSRTYDRDAGTVELIGKGMWSYWDHRTLLPVLADSARVTLPDGKADPAFNTSITATSYLTIAKRIVAQSMQWLGGSLPIVLPDDTTGAFERNYVGAELNLIGDMLRNLTGVEQGPDIRFVPRRTQDGLGYEWLMIVGAPRITSETVTTFDMSVPKNNITNFTATDDASGMAAISWVSGGRGVDEALIERDTDWSTVQQGYPLLETVSSLSTSVVEAATAKKHATEALRTSQTPTAAWPFSVRRDPYLGVYQAGYPCALKLKDDPFIPDGKYPRRIMAMSGGSDSDDIKIITGEQYG